MALLVIATYWKKFKCPSPGECIKTCSTSTQWNTTQQLKKKRIDYWYSQQYKLFCLYYFYLNSQMHCSNWNKPNSKCYIPYDPIYIVFLQMEKYSNRRRQTTGCQWLGLVRQDKLQGGTWGILWVNGHVLYLDYDSNYMTVNNC